ncbi:hypothetical protein DL764_004886 [Monosporascus ibericus]|uniref:Uncharacterized protein n=1 Tax=Monosporascus ibericus TaxID=155417 RepID=A0A4Q4TB05_9PEZI|nr:hypothetical protein DL764_004886 [Monosporascus ibericus]
MVNLYGIRCRLGFFTFDTANVKRKAIRVCSANSTLPQETQADPMANTCRLRCWGHIINIVATGLIFLEKDRTTRVMANRAVETAHKASTFIRVTPQCRDAFKMRHAAVRSSLQNVEEYLNEDNKAFEGPIFEVVAAPAAQPWLELSAKK